MPATAHQLPQHSTSDTAAPAAITIRWEISPTALLASPGAAILNGQASKLKACALLVHVDGAAVRAELACDLTTGEQSTIVLGVPASLERSENDSLESIAAAGVLSLSVRNGGHGPELLYARTPLLTETLSLPGGAYDAPAIV
jgi:hypothetical protein